MIMQLKLMSQAELSEA